MSQVWRDGRSPAVTCSARTVSGQPCKRPPIKGSNVCRAHGGAAPQVRAKAQVRILMSADAAAAKLIEMIHSKKVDDRTKLLAVKDLLDRANLSGTQSIEVGVTKRDFSDVVSDVVMDLDWDDDEDNTDVIDAEVIEDANKPETDEERWEREDAQHQRIKEIERMKRGQPSATTPDLNAKRARQEADAMRAHAAGELGDDDLLPEQAARRPQPDRFGVVRDTPAEDAARRRSAAASRRADKTVRSSRSTSTADPYADRYPERTGGRRTVSPKRYEQRKRDGGQG
ncbi:HGGxSTG domain-containing protein [Microbacterium hominis]|uniref:HGGxSTG domain-containing protein n=1 Tax=Microbacterium hominis TaxID=162426 RepID=UPI0012FC529B|nr:HGGxSTG domain-containing protein [Microbacterium hominis]